MGKSKNKKPKNELVFDSKERENFLKGFSKRKKQRQKKAQEEIELKLKEERKRIKDESKNLKVMYIFD
jgi:ribosomal RNA-processing protein 17